ncbi:MAG: GNAT family N-acetyltransferase [Candidatus Cohnella colombiensis]|uniref:GNAT family N-acetyltransferase n=1 Tax=Candidatus Cohnella colombiensis TaxID=3121368 RepID=A0AA95JHG4_9BACL|nr:MAG: GNAT family N-acetyltransferase [Cohnella sp.]
MYTDYIIEDASLDCLERIVEIYNSTIASRMVTADIEPVSVDSKRQWFEDHTSDHFPIWVMKKEGDVVAWFSFQPFSDRPAYDATAEISVYIAQEYRSQGIGSILLQRAIQVAPSLNLSNLVAYVYAHNEASLALLKKFQFEQWGYYPKVTKMDGVEMDVVALGRRVV